MHPGHLQPCQLHGAHRRGGAEALRRLQPQEAVWGHDPRRLPGADLRGGGQGQRRPQDQGARGGRPRGDNHRAPALTGGARSELHRRGARCPDTPHHVWGRRGGQGQGWRRLCHPLHGLHWGRVRRPRPCRPGGRAGRQGVHLRGVFGHGGQVFRFASDARQGGRRECARHRGRQRAREEAPRRDDAGPSRPGGEGHQVGSGEQVSPGRHGGSAAICLFFLLL
mmetsp:Transcript_47025/g.105728  ORF Transcript_47025/g.105728 Transcript_47025/m.105728 type:complete len:223 (-) Transcript_47025:71-739(-)